MTDTNNQTETAEEAPRTAGKPARKLPEAGQWPDKLAKIALPVSAIFMIAGFLLAFLYAPPVNGAAVSQPAIIGDHVVTTKLLLSQKIFYFHMPVAIASFVCLAFGAYYSIRFLISRNERFDLCAKTAMEVALVLVICTMITGEMWTRFEWGVWWTWEPRLTTYLILMLIVIAYFVMRGALAEGERRSVFSAVVSIIALIDVPICYMVTRIIPSSLHPVVLREGGMTSEMALTLVVCMIGIVLLAFVLYRLRFRSARVAQRTQALKELIDDNPEW